MVSCPLIALSYAARRAVIERVAADYRTSSLAQKGLLLDRVVEVTGYTRKYAIQLLGEAAEGKRTIERRRPPPRYGTEVQQALVGAWKAAKQLCSKRLIPFLPTLVAALERHGHLHLSEELYEAVDIDGVGRSGRFFWITLPQLKYTVITSTTQILTGSLTYFDLIWVMMGGGPGYATRNLPLQMYITAFQNDAVGYGSVLAVLLAIFGIALSLFLLRFTGFTRMSSQLEGL